MEIILTLQQQVKSACEVAGISLTELATRLGTSQQNLSKRIAVGKLEKEMMYKIAECLGCKYVCYFEFDNGTKIY